MTQKQHHLLQQFYLREIDSPTFLEAFDVDLRYDATFIEDEVRRAIVKRNADDLDVAIDLIHFHEKPADLIEVLNELLVNPKHTKHQIVTRHLQNIAAPSSIPFIQRVLESEFDYLQYTCSESDAIAKWFSWALFEIGTQEAFDLIEYYTKSEDVGIKKEMEYRWQKVKQRRL